MKKGSQKERNHCIQMYRRLHTEEERVKIANMIKFREPKMCSEAHTFEQNVVLMKRSTVVSIIQYIAAIIRNKKRVTHNVALDEVLTVIDSIQ